MADRRPIRLSHLLDHPGQIATYREYDGRLLDATTHNERARLRRAIHSGDPKDRVMGVIALARLRDKNAGEALSELLADPSYLDETVAKLGFIGEAFPSYQYVVLPGLFTMLASTDARRRRIAASICGQLRIQATAGPLLDASRALAADDQPMSHWFLAAAARITAAGPAADDVRQLLTLPDSAELDSAYIGHVFAPAVAAIAERGARYGRNSQHNLSHQEWAVRWCAENVLTATGVTCSILIRALRRSGPAGMEALKSVVRRNPPVGSAGPALLALVDLDPLFALRAALTNWRHDPFTVIPALGRLCADTGDSHAITVIIEAIQRSPHLGDIGAEALARIGGNAANRLATEIVRHEITRNPSDESNTRLRRVLGPRSPAHELARELVELSVISPLAAEVTLAELDEDEAAHPHDTLIQLFDTEGILVTIDPESGTFPPTYDSLLAEFVAATGGAIEVSDVALTVTPDDENDDDDAANDDGADDDDKDIWFSFVHNGQTQSWEPDNFGDWYDMLSVWEMTDSLTPADANDPREFVQIELNRYLFADPAALAEFHRRTGIDLTECLAIDIPPAADAESGPATQDQDAFLPAWLLKQAKLFGTWRDENHLEPRDWDFSPDSLDRLEDVVRQTLSADPDLRAPENAALFESAMWYFGETTRLNTPAEWRYIPGAPTRTNPLIANPYVATATATATPGGPTLIPAISLHHFLSNSPTTSLRTEFTRFANAASARARS